MFGEGYYFLLCGAVKSTINLLSFHRNLLPKSLPLASFAYTSTMNMDVRR
jgi:hypothetical protein